MAEKPQRSRRDSGWRCVVRSVLAGLAILPAASVSAEIPEVITQRSRFQIPFDFDATRLAAVGADTVELYVAINDGSWQLAKSGTPSERAFLYEASSEGSYDFCVRARKPDGTRIPDAPLSPSLHVIVDQTAPRIGVKLQPATNTDAILHWAVDDDAVDPETLAIERQLLDGRWTPVDAKQARQGKTLVATVGTTSIRVRIEDTAGNVAEQLLAIPKKTASAATVVTAGANTPSSVPSQPATDRVDNIQGAQSSNADLVSATRAIANGPAAVGDNASSLTQTASLQEPSDAPLAAPASWPAPVVTPGDPGANLASAMNLAPPQVAAATGPRDMMPGHGLTGHTNATASWAVAVTKRVNTRTFRLGYELEDVGPSGLSTVALYITEDHGQSWFHYGNDPDASSPMDVTVPNDGVYGFSFRVMSGTGFGDLPPQPGERPDVAIAVDQTAPQIRMLPLGHSQGANSHQLAIRWQAFDATLPPRPIRIEYGPAPSGPWTPVAPPLANSGEFVWDVSQPMPGAVYLRVTVSDAAGNEASDFTREPIMLDFSRPAARITAIEAVTN